MGGKPQRYGTVFMGEVDPSRDHLQILIWQLQEARLDEIVKRWGREMFIFHATIPALYPFWRKFYWLS